MEIEYLKSADRLLNRDCVNKGCLDASKEVLWVSIGQKAAELRAVKVEVQKTILPLFQVKTCFNCTWPIGRIYF